MQNGLPNWMETEDRKESQLLTTFNTPFGRTAIRSLHSELDLLKKSSKSERVNTLVTWGPFLESPGNNP